MSEKAHTLPIAVEYSDSVGTPKKDYLILPVEVKELPEGVEVKVEGFTSGKKRPISITLTGLKEAKLLPMRESIVFLPKEEISIKEGRNSVEGYTNLTAGIYLLPFLLTWKSSGREFSTLTNIPVEVKGTEDVFAYAEERTLKAGKVNEVSVVVANAGSEKVKGLTLSFVPSNLSLLSGEKVFIGELDGNDYTSETVKVVPTGGRPSLRVVVEYEDALGNPHSISESLPFTMSVEEKKEFPWVWAGAGVLLIILVFYFWRKR